MITLYRHQQVALGYMRLFDNFALFMEQGCGKTLPCLCRALELAEQHKICSFLVIAPKATMGAWTRDLELFDEPDKAVLRSVMTVVNYEAVWRKTDLDKAWLKSKKYSPRVKGDYDKQWDMIVLDESHKIKDKRSKQAQMAHKLALKAKYRYILTGTPICNGSLEDIWSQYAFLQPYKNKRGTICSTIFGGTYYDFLDKYAVLNQWYAPYKYLHVKELQKIIDKHSYRVLKTDCLDLPEKLPDEFYEIDLTDTVRYKELHDNSTLEEIDLVADNGLERMLRLRQFCSGFITTKNVKDDTVITETIEIANEKFAALTDFLSSWEKKLVIFAEFKHSVKGICNTLDGLKIKHVVLDGDQPNKDIWQDFQTDETLKVIVCQYKSASTGIDLFAADTILYFEPTISSNVLEQSRDRIHRIGQTQKCSYIHFITKGTIEEAIYKALRNFCDFNKKLFQEYMEQYQKSNYKRRKTKT